MLGGGASALHLRGFSAQSAASRTPDLQNGSPRRSANPASSTWSQLGDALTKLDDPPVKALVVYNSNPAAIAPGSERRAAPVCAATICSPSCSNNSRPIRPISPTSFSRHHLPRTHRSLLRLRPLPSATRPTRPPRARRNAAQHRSLPPPRRPHGLRRALLPRHGRRHDPCAPRYAITRSSPASPSKRSTREHSIRLQSARARSCLSPKAASARHPAAANSTRKRSITSRPSNRATAMRALRATFPLEMISPKNHDSMNSTFGYRPENDRETAVLTLHPEDAAPRGIATGDIVRAFNDRGRLHPRSQRQRHRGARRRLHAFCSLAEARAGRQLGELAHLATAHR